MTSSVQICASLALAALLTSCSIDTGPHLELTQQMQKSAEQHVTQRDLANCRSKLAEFTGTFGNTTFKLSGALRPNSKLTCMVAARQSKDEPVAHYSAPVEAVSGYRGIEGLQRKGTNSFWCRFKIKNGVASLEEYAIGLRANKTSARLCGFSTS